MSYVDNLSHIIGESVDKFFDFKDNVVRFTGNSLECHIPLRFATYGLLEIGNTVKTLGVCVLIIDGKYYTNLDILNMIEIVSTDTKSVVIDNIPYVIVSLNKGDIFMANQMLVQNSSPVYSIWSEFLSRGKPLYTFKRFEAEELYEHVEELTGTSLGVDVCVYEAVLSEICRDPDDLYIKFRNTDMTKEPKMVPIRSIQYTPTTTTTRLIGSYFGDGKMAALLNEDSSNSKIEDLYRSVPVYE